MTRCLLVRKSMGMGTLYISEARVSWVGIQGKVIFFGQERKWSDLDVFYNCLGRDSVWNTNTLRCMLCPGISLSSTRSASTS